MAINTSILVISLTLLLAACDDTSEAPGSPAADAATTEAVPSITLMTFNVENLFDTADDPGKDDHTYLPIASKQSDEHKAKCAEISVPRWRDQCLNWDWNEDILERKLTVLAAAILQVNDGRGPDVIALQEVENIAILERLRTQYLQAADYGPAVLIDGNDSRGIDVAFLTRLPLHGEVRLHDFLVTDKSRAGDTRGILEATFKLPDGALLTGFAVHFPAPYHPTEMRVSAYNQLNGLKSALPDDHFVFAAGDFNTTSSEDRDKKMLERFVHPLWTAVHEQGCEDCKGTNYYSREDSWSYLDMILWSAPENSGADATWGIRAGSVMIANKTSEQVTDKGTPLRFQSPEGGGVSDHWPVVFDLELK